MAARECNWCGRGDDILHMITLPLEERRAHELATRAYARKAVMTFNIGGVDIWRGLVVGDVFDVPETRRPYVTYTNIIAHVRNTYGVFLPPECVILDSIGRIALPWDIVYVDEASDVATLHVVQCTGGLDTSSLPTDRTITMEGINYVEDRPNALNPLPDAPSATVWTLRAAEVHSFSGERAQVYRVELCLCRECRELYVGVYPRTARLSEPAA